MFCADVSLLGKNVNTTKKNTETLLDTSEEIDLDVSTKKPKFISLCLINPFKL
jgi:hypothetical protein